MKNTRLVIGSIIALVAIVGVAALYTLRSHPTSTPATTMENMQTNTNSSKTTESPVSTDKVTIKDFAFSPTSITVHKGTTVTWTNNDSTAHTVTESDSLSGPASGQLTPGQTYSFTFASAGTYHYRCTLHADMTGTVVVTE